MNNFVSSDVVTFRGSESQKIKDGRVCLNPQYVKNLRMRLGVSQNALAELASEQGKPLSIATIKRLEKGNPVIYRTALQIAHLFNVEIISLIEKSENKTDHN